MSTAEAHRLASPLALLRTSFAACGQLPRQIRKHGDLEEGGRAHSEPAHPFTLLGLATGTRESPQTLSGHKPGFPSASTGHT